jgi:cold shock CspA family protein
MSAQSAASTPPTGTVIVCAKCANEFIFTAGEAEFYLKRKISPPQNCRACREKRKAEDAERLSRVEEAVSKAIKMTGIVEQYDAERGYGFIAVDGDLPVFFHCTSLRVNRKMIRAGVRVQFYRIPSARQPGKFCAERVVLAEENGAKP